jgi:hypothetical protein
MSTVKILHRTSSAKHTSPVAGGTTDDLQITASSTMAKRHAKRAHDRNYKILETTVTTVIMMEKNHSWDEVQESGSLLN